MRLIQTCKPMVAQCSSLSDNPPRPIPMSDGWCTGTKRQSLPIDCNATKLPLKKVPARFLSISSEWYYPFRLRGWDCAVSYCFSSPAGSAGDGVRLVDLGTWNGCTRTCLIIGPGKPRPAKCSTSRFGYCRRRSLRNWILAVVIRACSCSKSSAATQSH